MATPGASLLTGAPHDPGDQYWNMAVEPLLNTPDMRARQLASLQDSLARLDERSPFWRGWFASNSADVTAVNSLSDLAKIVPPFRKHDFREAARQRDFDMDRVLADISTAPADHLRLLAATSGTTGEPTPYPFTASDLQLFCEINARVWWRAGVRPGDRVLQAFALGMFVAGVPLVLSNLTLGACVIPVGAEAGVERILKTAKTFGATVMNSTPSLALHLIERAPDILGHPLADLGIRTLICGGEPGAGLPAVRQQIETGFGAKLFDFGAGAGGSCDHPEYQGMHWVADDLVLYELVDPVTDEPIPLEDGAEGEACFTSLGPFEGMTLVRQSVGDIHRVQVSPCPCGRSGLRYHIVGRTDDMLKVKGVMVYPAAIEEVIASFRPRVTGEFRIVLDEAPPRVVPPLRLKVERGQNLSSEDLADLERQLLQTCHASLRITPSITWLDPFTLERSEHKGTIFERTYEQ